jgi:methylphosphotriester-DNA--protein-cysteine methyltransferase
MRVILPTLVLVVMLVGCGSRFDDKVVVIEKTQTYHRPTCSQVVMARTEIETRAEARRKGYRPCPYCQPDKDPAGKPGQAE